MFYNLKSLKPLITPKFSINFLSLFRYEVESINRKRPSNERDDEISQDFTTVIIKYYQFVQRHKGKQKHEETNWKYEKELKLLKMKNNWNEKLHNEK